MQEANPNVQREVKEGPRGKQTKGDKLLARPLIPLTFGGSVIFVFVKCVDATPRRPKLKAVMQNVKDCERQMEATAKTFPEYPCLLSIPGFGPIVSAMVLAAIGNPSRFVNRKQLLRLAGLDLSASRSGQTSDTAKAVISKQGKAALRYALVQAAMIASSKNSQIRGYFSKLIQGRELECGIRLKMKVKLAAKLLVVAWTLMKNRQKFEASCFSG